MIFRSAPPVLHNLEIGKKISKELHEGVCSSHIGGRALAVTAMYIDYYWPSLREDAMHLVRTCNKCQKFAPVQRLPTPLDAHSQPLTICHLGHGYTWPFL